MILSGVDEAALGPKLGPFAAAAVSFETPAVSDEDLFKTLSDSLSQKPSQKPLRIAIADSKKLYSVGRGAATLEESVLAVSSIMKDPCPLTFGDFMESHGQAEDLKSLSEQPWLTDLSSLALPWAADSRRIRLLRGQLEQSLERKSIKIQNIWLRLVSARVFNEKIDGEGGKSGAVRLLLNPLLDRTLGTLAETKKLTVDRQGGRKFYGEWLLDLRPGAPWRSIEESSHRSCYQAKSTTVEFLVGADGERLETALASMFAKYARESAMVLFNRYWNKRVPGLKPTAGYPQDARRFLLDLKNAKVLPENLDPLVRKS